MKKLGLLLLIMVTSLHAKTFNKEIFESTIKSIKGQSYYNLTDDEIYQSALAGVLKHLETKNRERKKKHSPIEDANILLPPKNVAEMNKEIRGEVSGIGVSIQYDRDKGQGYPILTDIIKGGGAEHAGLQVGDQILKVDGQSVSKFKSFKDIVYKIRGKSGSKIRLSILRDGNSINKKIERKKISWDAVKIGERNNHYSLLKINFFNKKTVATLQSEFRRMKKEGINSLILDLRENTGGLFEEGLSAIKQFAKKDETVLLAKYKNEKTKKFRAESNGIGQKFKVIVLIGKNTKSMGEAFTSSLKQLTNAVVIGEKSFGKGTMETVLRLKNKHSVKFTVGRLYTPDDQTWDKEGIKPDIELPSSKEKASTKDHPLEIAKLLIKNH